MPKGELTRERRTIILNRLGRLDAMLYPEDDAATPRGQYRDRMQGVYYRALGEYFKRLPRVLMSVCPFTGLPLERAYDPFGLDGPWWHKDLLSKVDDPAPPGTFKVLLGALKLGARKPTESTEEVIPGPEVPFVVPRLLELKGMVAVVSQLKLHTGDVAYPIAYFSEEEIPPQELHQPWLRPDLWFKTPEGAAAWLIANDTWDFDLKPWVDSRKLRWVAERKGKSVVLAGDSGIPCPYLNLGGEKRPQLIVAGDRDLGELPTGEPLSPFEE